MKEYFIYLNIFVNMFNMILRLNNYLHKDDFSILNYWVNNDSQTNQIKSEIIDIFKININRFTKPEDVIILKNLFIRFSNSNISIDLKKYYMREISEIILYLFLKNKYNSKFPRSLFDDTFLNYIISEKLFFQSIKNHDSTIFEHLVANRYNIEYFDLKFNKLYENYYLDYLVKLQKNLKEQIYNSFIPDKSIINKLLGIIFMISKVMDIEDSNQKPSKLLINSTKNLYICLYNSLYETISINNESLKIYQYIDNEDNLSIIEPIKKNIILQIDEFNKCIDELKEYEYFLSDALRNTINTDNYNIKEYSSYQSDNLLHTLIYSVDDVNGLLFTGCVDNYLHKAKKCIISIFNDTKVNVHIKTKIILNCGKKSDTKFFFKYIDKLIDFFINIEKFNTDNGYNDKKKVRTAICEIINNYIKQFSERHFLNILSNFSKYKQENFYIIYFSHLNDIFTDFSKYKLLCYKNTKNNTSIVYLVRNLIYISNSSKIMNNLMCDIKDTTCHKFVELFHTITNNSYISKLYSDIPLFKNSELSKNILTDKCSYLLQELYEIFYYNLDQIYLKKAFIKYFSSGYYSKTLLDNTKLLFGEFVYTNVNNKKVKDLLTNLDNNVIDFLNNKEKIIIPARYLDPITFIEIENPVEIPEVNLILDEYTIYNHLTFNNTNPFTNKELTKQDLSDYNQVKDVLERTRFFSEDVLSWKNKL